MTQQEFEKIWNDSSEYVESRTSGSTGAPKTIRLSKEFMKESARRTNSFFGIDSGSRLHTCLDFVYIASKMMVVRASEAHCMLTSEIPSSAPLGEVGKEERIDLLSVVPHQMDWILASDSPWTGIRHILVGGAPVSESLRRRIAMSDYEVWESYGMTETASHIALRKIGEEDRPLRTLAGITVSAAEDGCLIVELPEGEKLKTNDIASIESPEEFRILGRADNCVISGGIKIIPEDLERLLGPFIAFDYCLSAVPDAKWGEKLVLVADVENVAIDAEVVKAAVGVRLRQYRKLLNLGVKSPKDVVCLPGFPRTLNGKIDRKKIKEILSGL